MKPAPPRPTIIIDTREVTPLVFSDAVNVIHKALPVGDYSLVGMERDFVVERKTLPDILGCIGRERERFERELRQFRGYRLSFFGFEFSWQRILTGDYRCPSQIHPNALFGSVLSFIRDYRVIPLMADDHKTLGQLVERIAILVYRLAERDWKAMTAEPDSSPGVDPAKSDNSSVILTSSPPLSPDPPMDLGDPLAAADNRLAKSHLDFARRKGA